VAGTMKYADNILKTFASANSIALSCVLSYYFLLGDDDNFTPTFLLGTLVIIFATFLYSSVKTVPYQLAPRLMDQKNDPVAVPLLPSKNRRLFPYVNQTLNGKYFFPTFPGIFQIFSVFFSYFP
jgi:UDP-sugar transporter A1/2/3